MHWLPSITEGLITEVIYIVKCGEEATVCCCQAHPSTGVEFLAAKVYHARSKRNFKNDSIYQEGRVILNRHVRRAVQRLLTARAILRTFVAWSPATDCSMMGSGLLNVCGDNSSARNFRRVAL